MLDSFTDNEKLYRAVYPPEIAAFFWKANGELSSAAFKDKKGLSVERGNFRTNHEVADWMHSFFTGIIFYILARDCFDVNAVIKYLPSKRSIYHSEIHGGSDRILLSQSQCKHLAKQACII